MKLSELTEGTQTGSVTIRGKDLTVRLFVDADVEALERQLPVQPPREDGKDLNHPARLAFNERVRLQRQRIIFAAGAGITNNAGEEWNRDRDGDWCRSFADQIGEELAAGELRLIHEEMNRILEGGGTLAGMIGDATKPGNSSCPAGSLAGQEKGPAGNSPKTTE